MPELLDAAVEARFLAAPLPCLPPYRSARDLVVRGGGHNAGSGGALRLSLPPSLFLWHLLSLSLSLSLSLPVLFNRWRWRRRVVVLVAAEVEAGWLLVVARAEAGWLLVAAEAAWWLWRRWGDLDERIFFIL
jgi:hypothetical protein